MSISFAKPAQAGDPTATPPSVVGFSAPIATWLSIITSIILAASFFFSHLQKSSDDSAALTAQQAVVQQKLSDHDKALLDMTRALAKIDGKIDVLLSEQNQKSAQQSNSKQK